MGQKGPGPKHQMALLTKYLHDISIVTNFKRYMSKFHNNPTISLEVTVD